MITLALHTQKKLGLHNADSANKDTTNQNTVEASSRQQENRRLVRKASPSVDQ